MFFYKKKQEGLKVNRLMHLLVDLPEDIKRYVYYGNYDKALSLIEIYLERNIPSILKERLIFEKERIRRLKEEYIYTFNEALTLAQKEIRDFTREELEALMDERYADWAYVDGQVTFHNRFLENIMKVNVNIKDRLINPQEDSSALFDEVIDKIIDKKEIRYHIHVKAGLRIKDQYARYGQVVRVHIPIPQEAQQIKKIEILSTSHNPKFICPPYYPQRTIYFEEALEKGTEFAVEYSYENHIKYKELSAEGVSRHQPSFYTEEVLPHVRFTPYLVELSQMIVGEETNPLLKARKIYDYITKNIQYSYVPQYAVITNIPEYAAYNLKGDCGIQALLFITLCRIAKIPARWQSGLVVNPKFIGCHDWAQFYIEPYGWLFADLSFGGSAYRNKNMKRWNYYFGNLDPFRMAANSEFHYDLYPEKRYLRSDPYDNQVGEAEYPDRPIYPYEYDIIQEIVQVKEI